MTSRALTSSQVIDPHQRVSARNTAPPGWRHALLFLVAVFAGLYVNCFHPDPEAPGSSAIHVVATPPAPSEQVDPVSRETAGAAASPSETWVR